MESNIQITAVNKEFRNGTKGYEVCVSGLDSKLNASMNFTDPLKAMRYMFLLSKKLELQINKIDLAALSIAYKRIKDLEAKVVENTENTINMVAKEIEEPEKEIETVELKFSPMQAQYMELKEKHPDALLLFRCGDFYESYMEDAEICAKTLGITLTKRSGDNVPMAGFPYHALDEYLPKLIRAGHRIAICDQIEDPAANKLVKRGITELVSTAAPAEDAAPKRRGRKKANAQQELKLEVAE